MKFPLNRLRTCKFQLKLFDTSVTLIYGQGAFDIYHIYNVRENRNVKVFATPYNHPASRPAQHKSLHSLDSHFSCEPQKCGQGMIYRTFPHSLRSRGKSRIRITLTKYFFLAPITSGRVLYYQAGFICTLTKCFFLAPITSMRGLYYQVGFICTLTVFLVGPYNVCESTILSGRYYLHTYKVLLVGPDNVCESTVSPAGTI